MENDKSVAGANAPATTFLHSEMDTSKCPPLPFRVTVFYKSGKSIS